MKKSIADQIKDLENTRAAKIARNEKITQKASDDGHSMDESQQEEFDTASDEIDALDADLVRLRRLEKQLGQAKPVKKGDGDKPENASRARDPHIEVLAPKVEKGIAFARYVGALVRSKFNLLEASEFAKRWSDSTPEVSLVLKSASAAGTTTATDWASKLVEYTTMTSEFLELLRPMTIVGRFGTNGIPALRSVPFNTRMVLQNGGGTHRWVGQGLRKPVGELSIDEVTLAFSKTSGIIVMTDELMRFSSPSAEMIVRDDLLRGSAAFVDESFVDPSVGPASAIMPAAITYNVAGSPASGTTAAHLRADLEAMWAPMWAANLPLASGVFITSNRLAQRLSLMRTALGVREFPEMTAQGGSLEGFPVIASEAVPSDSAGDVLIFVLANSILLADDGGITIDSSREASLQLGTDPEGADTAAAMVSLWQRNLVALRAERFIRWEKAREGIVSVITAANYSGAPLSS
ncbi:MAG: phage major capsid protein [Gammaproteobacteria bacterium]